MKIGLNPSAIRQTTLWEVTLRFLLGGTITVIAGLLAKKFGPAFGGLFLAFPAIFPASATLIEKHEHEKKVRAGITHTIRGRKTAAVSARGATLGGFALVCFALAVWQILPRWPAPAVLFVALLLWLAVAVGAWEARRIRRRWVVRKRRANAQAMP